MEVSHRLRSNPGWPDCPAPLPEVDTGWSLSAGRLRVRFQVTETEGTWRCAVGEDQGPVWQDSCVEVFLACASGGYANFEFNARGCCLAARGPDRLHRRPLSPAELSRVLRRSLPSSPPGLLLTGPSSAGMIRWGLELEIPLELLGLEGNPGSLRGNLQKCGELTAGPHWLTLFPIPTARPDFHRPEFFGELLGVGPPETRTASTGSRR